jgi:hypothetical protein
MQFGKIAKLIPGRTSSRVRARYLESLDPAIKKGKFTDEV